MSPRISTCLILNNRAEEAAQFYVSLFEDGRILEVSRTPPGSFLPEGGALAVVFELAGSRFMILNHGPDAPFTDAQSIVITCDDQAEIDRLWAALSDGGAEMPCGWLRDRYGVRWQIAPSMMGEVLSGPDRAAASRAFAAMMTMKKLDIATLMAARDWAKLEEMQ